MKLFKVILKIFEKIQSLFQLSKPKRSLKVLSISELETFYHWKDPQSYLDLFNANFSFISLQKCTDCLTNKLLFDSCSYHRYFSYQCFQDERFIKHPLEVLFWNSPAWNLKTIHYLANLLFSCSKCYRVTNLCLSDDSLFNLPNFLPLDPSLSNFIFHFENYQLFLLISENPLILLAEDFDNSFSKNLLYFLLYRVFPSNILDLYSLSLSFNPRFLPSSLLAAKLLASEFTLLLQAERFYFVVEGSFTDDSERPNIHILFTLSSQSFSHRYCLFERNSEFCFPCKSHYLRLWNKGAIYLRKIIEKGKDREKVFSYFTKIKKPQEGSRQRINSPNFPLLKDYWERVEFSSQFQQKYLAKIAFSFNVRMTWSHDAPASCVLNNKLFSILSSELDSRRVADA